MDPRLLRRELQESFSWVKDIGVDAGYADVTSWWARPDLLAELGPALADLHRDASPSIVVGMASRGTLLGSLVALHLGVGLVEVRKNPHPSTDSDPWHVRTTPPDYRDRHLSLGFRRSLLSSHHRVLVVDDWVDTGAQATAVQQLVGDAGATLVGTAVVVDALEDSALRRRLQVRSLLHVRDL